MNALRCAAAVLVVLVRTGGVGHAAPGGDAIGDSATDIAASAWDWVKAGAGGLWTAVSSLFATPDPFESLPEQMPNRDQRFLALMDASGYRLIAIDTSEGIVCRVRVRFAQQRTPSPDLSIASGVALQSIGPVPLGPRWLWPNGVPFEGCWRSTPRRTIRPAR